MPTSGALKRWRDTATGTESAVEARRGQVPARSAPKAPSARHGGASDGLMPTPLDATHVRLATIFLPGTHGARRLRREREAEVKTAV
jgi:hypothetical protein